MGSFAHGQLAKSGIYRCVSAHRCDCSVHPLSSGYPTCQGREKLKLLSLKTVILFICLAARKRVLGGRFYWILEVTLTPTLTAYRSEMGKTVM